MTNYVWTFICPLCRQNCSIFRAVSFLTIFDTKRDMGVMHILNIFVAHLG